MTEIKYDLDRTTMNSISTQAAMDRIQQENEEKARAEMLFNAIESDLMKAIELELKKNSISMISDSMENNIIDEIEHSLHPITKEILKMLSKIKEFNYFDAMYNLFHKVVVELYNNNTKVYKAGIYQNPKGYGEEVIQGWYSCDKTRIEKYAKDIIKEQIGDDYTEEQKQRLRNCFFCEEA